MRAGYHPRRQGDLGEFSALDWLASTGATVFVPVGHSPDVDVVADFDGQLVRVQVKTCGLLREGALARCARHPRRQSELDRDRQALQSQRADYLFVHVADGDAGSSQRPRSPAAPRSCSGGRSTRHSRSSRAARSRPLRARVARLDPCSAGFPSGQRGAAVNRMASLRRFESCPRHVADGRAFTLGATRRAAPAATRRSGGGDAGQLRLGEEAASRPRGRFCGVGGAALWVSTTGAVLPCGRITTPRQDSSPLTAREAAPESIQSPGGAVVTVIRPSQSSDPL